MHRKLFPILFIYFSCLCFPSDTLNSGLSICVSLSHFPCTNAAFHNCRENVAEVIFFICFHFQFYCNSSRDLQLITEAVYCLVRDGFVPCGVENSTPSQHREILQPEILRCHVALHPFCLNVKPWVFYCPGCQQHYAFTIGATTGLAVITELSPISKGAMTVSVWVYEFMKSPTKTTSVERWNTRKEETMSMGGMTLNEMQSREIKIEEENERLYRSMCYWISTMMPHTVHLCRRLQKLYWCFCNNTWLLLSNQLQNYHNPFSGCTARLAPCGGL